MQGHGGLVAQQAGLGRQGGNSFSYSALVPRVTCPVSGLAGSITSRGAWSETYADLPPADLRYSAQRRF